MNPPRYKQNGHHRYGPAPTQGKLPLGAESNGSPTKLEKRLAEDPDLLRRIAEFAAELGSEQKSSERNPV